MYKISWSRLAIILSFLIFGYLILSNKHWRKKNTVIQSDVVAYYSYIPSFFIYGDASHQFLDEKIKDPEVEIWAGENEEGFRVIKTTMGISYFYFPFFVVAHHVAINSGYKTNGFSTPYKMAIILCAFFFFMWALIFLRKYLLFFFSEIVVFWTLLIVGIGTNVVNYIIQEPGMSHVYSFFLISVFIYYTHIWYKEKRLKHLFLLGFLSGWIVLARPTNALVVLVFIFYRVDSFSALGKRLKLFLLKFKAVLFATIVSFAVVLPQLLYWKYNTSDWIYYSYPDEAFFFGDPKIIDGLFSYRKGWLLYTPLMALSFLGFWIDNKKTNAYKYTLFMLLIVFLYVTFSWWSWWYGGSFGMRPMIDIYPLLAFTIAIFLTWISKLPLPVRLFSNILISAFIFLNLFQNYQYRRGVIRWDNMTKESYWFVWGKTKWSKDIMKTLAEPTDGEKARKGIDR